MPVELSIEKKSIVSDSIKLRVNVIETSDGVEGRQLYTEYYPKTITIEKFDIIALPIELYGASKALWPGPKGFTGTAMAGADGSIEVQLFPAGRSKNTTPYVRYQSIPACMGCMMSAASPFFESAKNDLLTNYDSTLLSLVSIPKQLVIQKKSATLVTYTFKDSGGAEVRGVAYYSTASDSSSASFEQAEFVLPDNKALTDALMKLYIDMYRLK